MSVAVAGAVGTVEAAARMGVSKRVLDYWSRTGVLAADVEATGSGSRRQWAPRTIEVGRVLRYLSELGAQGDTLAAAAVQLRTVLAPGRRPDEVWVNREGDVSPWPMVFASWYVNLDDLAALD